MEKWLYVSLKIFIFSDVRGPRVWDPWDRWIILLDTWLIFLQAIIQFKPFDFLTTTLQDLCALFMVMLYFSKYSNIKLGKDNEPPQYNGVTWYQFQKHSLISFCASRFILLDLRCIVGLDNVRPAKHLNVIPKLH